MIHINRGWLNKLWHKYKYYTFVKKKGKERKGGNSLHTDIEIFLIYFVKWKKKNQTEVPSPVNSIPFSYNKRRNYQNIFLCL